MFKRLFVPVVSINPERCLLLIAAFLISAPVFAQELKQYTIDISKVRPPEIKDLPMLGGSNPQNQKIAVNNYFITKGGKPIIPITGEFHYTRYPHQYWDESIKKMKAGGINMIATYVFWNIHEEKEGVFNWSGDRDLHRFIELCAKNDMPVIVRIGPFDHGEIRNGGIPDWILGKPLTVRTNDPLYLHYTEILYNEIGKQLKGLYYKDGGPVIGVQLENEYQHSASPWGLTYPGQPYDFTVADRDRSIAQEGVGVANANNPYAQLGNDHMRTLKALAIKAGMETPLYTATGWGHAAVIPNETLPVTAAYAYPTWTTKRQLSPFYLYKDIHQMPDYSPVRYNPMDYPAFAAELGSGIMSTYSRRPIVPAESIDALINRCLGSGANGIGYYMFHGGSTPVGEHYFFNDEAYAYPKISYDFQAPIGEYGQIRPSYNRLKLIHFFLNDFADKLAPEVTVLPDNAATLKPADLSELRYAARTDGKSGFLFINNFQDNAVNEDKPNVRVTVNTTAGKITIPEQGSLTIKAGENCILPFNLDINHCQLRYATAQLLTKCDESRDKYYVFFPVKGNPAKFCFSKAGTTVQVISNATIKRTKNEQVVKTLPDQPAEFLLTAADGTKTRILVIDKDMALKANIVTIRGQKHLLFTEAEALPDEKSVELESVGANEYQVSLFPSVITVPDLDGGIIKPIGKSKLFSTFRIVLPKVDLQPQVVRTGTRKASVSLPAELPKGLNDLFLKIDYIGDTGMAFLNGELVADEFYKGIPWEIGLKRFLNKPHDDLGLYFRPVMKNAPFIVDLPPKVVDELSKAPQTLQIEKIQFVPEYKATLKF